MGTQKILLRLHWSTLNHCGPLLRLPAHAGDSDVPADLVESLLHQHDMPQFAVLQHILLGRQPPRSWLERAAEEPGLLLWLLMSRQALFEVEDPWRVGIRVVLTSSLALLGPSWVVLGRLGARLGAVLGRLGPSWGHLGGRLGAILGPSGAVFGPSWGHLGAILGPYWGHLGEYIVPKMAPRWPQ